MNLVSREHVQSNNLINTLKEEEKIETGEKYPLLDKTGEKK